MSHMTKLILRIIMMRARSRIRPEIGREQCGFVEDSGTRNALSTNLVKQNNFENIFGPFPRSIYWLHMVKISSDSAKICGKNLAFPTTIHQKIDSVETRV